MNFYGYKNHLNVDKGTKLIRTYAVTSASVHESNALEDLINEADAGQKLNGDSPFNGKEASI